MSKSKTYTVGYKRKIQGKTDYHKRLRYLKSEKVRIAIRPSLNNLKIQAILFEENGDKILATTSSKELRKLGWKYHLGNLPSSYLTGLYFGMVNKDKIKKSIIDLGLRSLTKGDRLSATIKGIVDSGMEVAHSDSIFPKEDRLKGKAIADYAKILSSDKDQYNKQFSKSLKEGANPENIVEEFEKIKAKILNENG